MFGGNKPFSFSTPAANPPANPPAAAASSPFSFGASAVKPAAAAAPSALSGSFSFGGASAFGGAGTTTQQPTTATNPTANLFGAQKPAATASIFGQNTAPPSTTTSSFNFSNPSAQPTSQPAAISSPFGASSTGFGQSALAPKPAAPTSSFSFGGASSTSSNNLFGQAAKPLVVTATSAIPPSSTGFSLGGSSAAGSGFNFGGAASTSTTNIAPTAAPATSLFGTSAATTTAAKPAGFGGFNSASTPSFGASTTTPSFGAPTTTAAVQLAAPAAVPTGAGFGGFNLGGGTATPTSTTSIAAPTAPVAAPSTGFGGFNLGASSSTGTTGFNAASLASPIGLGTQPGRTVPTLGVSASTNSLTGASSGLGGLGFGLTTAAATIKPADAKPTFTLGGAPATTGLATPNKPTFSLGGLSGLGTATTTAATTPTLASSLATAPATTITPVKPAEQPKLSLGGALGGASALTGLGALSSLAGTTKPVTTTLSGNLGGTSLGGTTSSTAATGSAAASSGASSLVGLGSTSSGAVIRSQLPKDQPLPQPLAEAFENFRKYFDEMKKTKELNLTFNNNGLRENIQAILVTTQKMSQTKTEVQHNLNDIVKLKAHVQQESRNVEICEQLKDMPLGLQYENEIWNEYFSQRIQNYEQKMKNFKIQFEQLNDYFKVHDKDNMLELQKIIETVKVTHKNLLNEAANLKYTHEQIEELKRNFLLYKRKTTGETNNIFEKSSQGNNENLAPSKNVSLDFLK